MAASDFTRAGSPITATGFNCNVAATRAATLNGTNGAMFDRNPMGDTTFFVSKQPRPIRDKKVSQYLPFTLRVVNVGTAASPTYRKLFYFPDYACDVDDGWAECDNAAYSGQETWAQDGKWFYVADADGDEVASRTLDQKKVEYVYLHVLSSYDAQGAMRSAIVTNSKLIPEDFNGMRTDCICIGHFSVPTDSQVSSGTQPKVLEQFVQGQVQVYGGRFPLQLSVVNIGTEASPEWVKCFYFTDRCVYYDGDIYASCINAAYPGYTAGGEGLYFVAKADGTTTTPPLQEDVSYVYLHVKKVSSSRVEMIVTNDDATIPTAWDGEEDYCCCVGRFSTPSQSQVSQGTVPFVEEQFVRSQVQITPNTTDFPFEIRQINEGTESSPSYTTIIHIPDGAIKCCFPTYPDGNLVVHHDDWYTYSGNTGQIGLKIYLSFKKQETGEEPVTNPARCYWTLGDWSTTYTPTGVDSTYFHAYNYPLGFVRSDNTCYNLARSAIAIPADFLKAASYGLGGGSGGSGGSYVAVTDNRSVTTRPGIVGFSGGVGSQASPFQFGAKDGIGPDIVFFDTTEGAEKTLIDYLSGDYEATLGSTELGKNVNTEVFGELCLGPEQTPDIDPEEEQQDLAAPSAHVHTLSQFVNDAGEALEGDDVLGWFDDLGITGQISGEGNLLTDADIQTSASVYQKDGTASAGTYANLLALADHVHPLNAGTTHETYAYGDHAHGNITNDGKISGTPKGVLVVTDDDSGEITTGPSLVPAGWSETYDSDLELLDGLRECFGLYDAGGVTGYVARVDLTKIYSTYVGCLVNVGENGLLGADDSIRGEKFSSYDTDVELLADIADCFNIVTSGQVSELRIPTSRLTCDVDQHQNKCLLVADGTDVTHSGNRMYNMLDAATDSTKDATKILTDKDLGSGLEFTSTSVLAVKPKSNGGITVTSDGVALSTMTANSWCKTDESGNLSTTNEVPLVLNAQASGVVYNTNGAVSYMALGTTDGTIAEGDHTHGILDSSGNLTGTGIGGGIVYANSDSAMAVDMSLHNSYSDWEVLCAVADAFDFSSSGGSVTAKMPANSVQDANCTSDDCMAVFKTVGSNTGVLCHTTSTELRYSEVKQMRALFEFTTDSTSKATAAKLKHDSIEYSDATTLTSPKVLGFAADTAQHGTVSLLDAAILAPKTGDTGASDSNAPVADLWVGDSESTASKIARIGTSSYAARADHQHPVECATGTPVESTTVEPGTRSTVLVAPTLDTNDLWSAGNQAGNGLTVLVLSRIIETTTKSTGATNETYRNLVFREATFSKNGNLLKVGKEVDYCTMRKS